MTIVMIWHDLLNIVSIFIIRYHFLTFVCYTVVSFTIHMSNWKKYLWSVFKGSTSLTKTFEIIKKCTLFYFKQTQICILKKSLFNSSISLCPYCFLYIMVYQLAFIVEVYFIEVIFEVITYWATKWIWTGIIDC